MKMFRLLPLCAAIGAGLGMTLAGPARAQSLITLYDSARGYDAAYQSAKAQYEATLARAAQARAGLLPTAGLSLTSSRSSQEIDTPVVDRRFGTQTSAVSISQPLYRPANLIAYEQGKRSLEQAQAQLEAAEQDLVVRLSVAYFDVLGSQDSLTFVRAQKAAVAEQLAAAKRNFEVGTSTITDTREAQARYDLVVAQEVAAENDLRVKKIALDVLVGKTGIAPLPLAPGARLPELGNQDLEQLVHLSEETHPSVRQAQVGLEIASLEVKKAVAGHKPTLDLTGNYSVTRNIDGSTTSGLSSRVNLNTFGLSFNLPLFTGFATQNHVKETLSLEEKARSDLDAARRNVAQSTRTAYFGVISGEGQVKALEAAEASSQSALDANKLGYQVGVRINIDVLNSQSQLYQTKRDLAKARYDLLLGTLRLKLASGTLKPEDLQKVNDMLVSRVQPPVPAAAAAIAVPAQPPSTSGGPAGGDRPGEGLTLKPSELNTNRPPAGSTAPVRPGAAEAIELKSSNMLYLLPRTTAKAGGAG